MSTTQELTITIVPDEPCPECGAAYGHADPALNFPNRPKVGHWFKCYNPACPVGYYDPMTGETELAPTPEQEARQKAAQAAHTAEWNRHNRYVYQKVGNCTTGVPIGINDPTPEGWHDSARDL